MLSSSENRPASYTGEQLESAVELGIITRDQLQRIELLALEKHHGARADEENFRLLGGFNDIFTMLASVLLLFSAAAAISMNTGMPAAMAVTALASWLLAEYFVRRKGLALTGIVLLLAFVASSFALVQSALPMRDLRVTLLAAGIAGAAAAWLHWRRFRIPITVAAGTGSVLVSLFILLPAMNPALRAWMPVIFLLGGLLCFALAMYWDSSDPARLSRRADTAFWLHLMAAPLIVHPVFMLLGLDRDKTASGGDISLILTLYLILCVISLIIDRRALMLSAMLYMIAALNGLIGQFGSTITGYQQATYAGITLGLLLLLLSGFWQQGRKLLLRALPLTWQQRLPPTR